MNLSKKHLQIQVSENTSVKRVTYNDALVGWIKINTADTNETTLSIEKVTLVSAGCDLVERKMNKPVKEKLCLMIVQRLQEQAWRHCQKSLVIDIPFTERNKENSQFFLMACDKVNMADLSREYYNGEPIFVKKRGSITDETAYHAMCRSGENNILTTTLLGLVAFLTNNFPDAPVSIRRCQFSHVMYVVFVGETIVCFYNQYQSYTTGMKAILFDEIMNQMYKSTENKPNAEVAKTN